jgi:hypothetical protein
MIGICQNASDVEKGITGFGLLVPQTIGAESVRAVEQDTIDFSVPSGLVAILWKQSYKAMSFGDAA